MSSDFSNSPKKRGHKRGAGDFGEMLGLPGELRHPIPRAGLSRTTKSGRGRTMRTLGKLLVAGIVIFAALQLVRPSIPVRPAPLP